MMEWLSCKKLSCYSLRVGHQMFISVLAIICVSLVAITLIITVNVYLLSNSSYKDIINILDTQEFNQIAYFGMAVEFCSLSYSQTLRMYSSELALLRKLLENPDGIGLFNLNYKYNFLSHLDELDVSATHKMVYFSNTLTSKELYAYPGFQKLLNIIHSMRIYIQAADRFYIFSNKNPYEKDEEFREIDKIVLTDNEFQTVFFYKSSNVNTALKVEDLLNYVKDAYSNMELFTDMIEENVPVGLLDNLKNFNNSVYKVPLYQENNIYDKFYSTNNELIKNLVTSNFYSDDSNLQKSNYLSKIKGSVFLLSHKSVYDMAHDKLAEKVKGITILLSDWSSPYKIYTRYQCANFHVKQNKAYMSDFDKEIISIDSYKHLTDCFSGKSDYIDDIAPNLRESDEDKFNYVYELFDTVSFDLTTNALTLINKIENEKLINYLSLNNLNYNMRLLIHNNRYKILKTYSPLSTRELFDFYYPITNLQLSFIFKNEAFFNNYKNHFDLRNIGNFIMAFVASLMISYFILCFILYHLFKVMYLIQNPLITINRALAEISDKGKLSQSKAQLEEYIYKTSYKLTIDEFVDLITIILDMIEGNMNLKSEDTLKDQYKMKIGYEDCNKAFTHIKINNMILLESLIMENLEKDNYLNEILSVDIIKIMENPVLCDSEIFPNLIKQHLESNNTYRQGKGAILNEEEYKQFDFEVFNLNAFNTINSPKNMILKMRRKDSIYKQLDTSSKTIEEPVLTNSNNDFEDNDKIKMPENIEKLIKRLQLQDKYFQIKLKETSNPLFNDFSTLKTEKKLDNLF